VRPGAPLAVLDDPRQTVAAFAAAIGSRDGDAAAEYSARTAA
jgi:hypothetical protein